MANLVPYFKLSVKIEIRWIDFGAYFKFKFLGGFMASLCSGFYKRHLIDKQTGSANSYVVPSMTFSSNSIGHDVHDDKSYVSFCPAPLPLEVPFGKSSQIVDLLGRAHASLRVLESVAELIPDIDLVISMYVSKEALMSSQIEGTQATLEDILDPQREENCNLNVREVVNYVDATEFALSKLKDMSLCNRLLKETHAVLMKGVRGENKNPGEFRTSQNWIGGQGSSLQNARYVPPAPDDMNSAMGELEKYINSYVTYEDLDLTDGLSKTDVLNKTDVLIRAALIHYQFETIHPFLDGNGRMGRLLITLFLIEQKVLSRPAIYISYFLKRNREEYYSRLMAVRTDSDFEQWVQFFLQALIEAAEDATATIKVLVALRQQNKALIAQTGRTAARTQMVFDYLERHPIIEIGKTAKDLKLSYNTVASAVNWLVDKGILVQTTNFKRNRVFYYEAYLKILRPGTELTR